MEYQITGSQSNLIGIETPEGGEARVELAALNRTLLELKLCNPIRSILVVTPSQSNLIGIETTRKKTNPICVTHSQSNLIGIETGKGLRARLQVRLSIEPYWN